MVTQFPANILGTEVDLLLNGTWTNITQYVYQRQDITIAGRGRPDETQQISPATLTLTLNNINGNFSPLNSSGLFYPYIGRNVQIRISVNSESANNTAYSGYRFWGEVSAWPPLWDPTGSDVYVTISAGGVMRRYVQGGNVGSSLKRFYTLKTNNTAPVALWTMEELSGATRFGNSIMLADPMTWTGGPPTLSSDSTSFQGTDPLPLISLATITGTTGSYSVAGGSVTYTTPGTSVFTAPGATSSLTSAECWGGGGGGGEGTGDNLGGAGGGGGEYAKETSVAVTAGSNYNAVVGAGGTGSTGGNSTAGGTSTFTGNSVTVTAHGGGLGNDSGGTGGAGGTGSTNTTHFSGGAGTAGFGGTDIGGTGGGSSGGSASAGNGGSAPSGGTGGPGGAAVTGGGAGGSGGTWGACVDAETLILTRRGWLPYDEVHGGDETQAISLDTGQTEWTPIVSVATHDGHWTMTLLTGPGISACANASHRWLVRSAGSLIYRLTRDLRGDDEILLSDGSTVAIEDCQRTSVVIDGTIWCPTTGLGNWLAMRDGLTYFIGNKP